MDASLVYTFGEGRSWQLGTGTHSSQLTPKLMEILEGADVVRDIVAGGRMTWELRGMLLSYLLCRTKGLT